MNIFRRWLTLWETNPWITGGYCIQPALHSLPKAAELMAEPPVPGPSRQRRLSHTSFLPRPPSFHGCSSRSLAGYSVLCDHTHLSSSMDTSPGARHMPCRHSLSVSEIVQPNCLSCLPLPSEAWKPPSHPLPHPSVSLRPHCPHCSPSSPPRPLRSLLAAVRKRICRDFHRPLTPQGSLVMEVCRRWKKSSSTHVRDLVRAVNAHALATPQRGAVGRSLCFSNLFAQ